MPHSANNADSADSHSRYDRVAPLYDRLEATLERTTYRRWRAQLWRHAEGERLLEIGVGTGKNIPYHPHGRTLIGIDFSAPMLRQTRRRAAQFPASHLALAQMDAQHLAFRTGQFDTVAATFVLGSVPDVRGSLDEIRRVTRRGGRVLLLEFARPAGLRGRITDMLNPLVRLVYGANINRDPLAAVSAAGFDVVHVSRFWGGMVLLIRARVP